jgi:hypothetical protein
LLNLLLNLIDRFERTANVTLNRAEDLPKDIEDACMGAGRREEQHDAKN